MVLCRVRSSGIPSRPRYRDGIGLPASSTSQGGGCGGSGVAFGLCIDLGLG